MMTRSIVPQKLLPVALAVAGLAWLGVAAGFAAPDTAAPAAARMQDKSAYVGITEPSMSIKLGFSVRGVVDKVEVKRNDKVKAGQPIISLQDIEEVATLNMYKLRADTSLQVAEAQETYEVKKIDWERKTKMFKEGNVATDFEVRSAEAEMNIAKLRIDQAKHEGETSQAQADAQAARIALMHKTSPIDGEVRDVIVKPGEQVDETKPVVEIVKMDPLYVEVKLIDTATVQKLKLGDKVQVKYADESRWREAVVESIDPNADSRTTTHPFRLSLPNPEGRNAGLRVEIQLPSNVAAAQ
jgi:RND family efflux transporter MFP subunit